jgi:hypothetical protein
MGWKIGQCGVRKKGTGPLRIQPDLKRTQADLQQWKRAVVSHMSRIPKQPQRIRSIFQYQQFRYAAQSKLTENGSLGGAGPSFGQEVTEIGRKCSHP